MLKLVPLAAFAVMLVATMLRGLSVRRQSGNNPWAFVTAKGVQRLAGTVFAGSVGVVAAAAWLVARAPAAANGSLWAAALLSVVGVTIVVIAQLQMGAAWRVGLRDGDTPLFVTSGLFRFSRNPIFVGMFLLALGTALAAGHWWGWIALLLFAISVRVQVSLEERHLLAGFGEAYAEFCCKVPRWIGFSGKQA
jgi:protein-S-isoprenylcysteine O-methyltransferase Ste14